MPKTWEFRVFIKTKELQSSIVQQWLSKIVADGYDKKQRKKQREDIYILVKGEDLLEKPDGLGIKYRGGQTSNLELKKRVAAATGIKLKGLERWDKHSAGSNSVVETLVKYGACARKKDTLHVSEVGAVSITKERLVSDLELNHSMYTVDTLAVSKKMIENSLHSSTNSNSNSNNNSYDNNNSDGISFVEDSDVPPESWTSISVEGDKFDHTCKDILKCGIIDVLDKFQLLNGYVLYGGYPSLVSYFLNKTVKRNHQNTSLNMPPLKKSLSSNSVSPKCFNLFIASNSPIKKNAVKNAACASLENLTLNNIHGHSTTSGISEQPIGQEETYTGAQNRLQQLEAYIIANSEEFDTNRKYNFLISIESGVMKSPPGPPSAYYYDIAWIIIKDLLSSKVISLPSLGVPIETKYVEHSRKLKQEKTCGLLMAEDGEVSDAKDPHFELVGSSRALILEHALQIGFKKLINVMQKNTYTVI